MLNFNWVTVGAFLLLCGTVIILSSWVWKSALRQRRRLRWPRVTGKVIEHRMPRDGPRVRLEYLVTYEIEGEAMRCVAKDWIPGAYSRPRETHAGSGFEELMRKRLAAYPEGGPIELLVDPDNPRRVFYRRGITWPLLPLAVLVTAVLLALLAALTPVIFVAPILPDATATSKSIPRGTPSDPATR